MTRRRRPSFDRVVVRPTLEHKLGGGTKINLILGPGAARGLMHVGAMRGLIEQGYEIESIIGSSVGAFIALLYAKTQNMSEVEDILASRRFHNLFRHKGQRQSLLSLRLDAATITRYFTEMFGNEDLTFEGLGFPIAFTATNLITRSPVFLRHGKVLPALLASATLPLINPPQYIDGVPYIDGGLILNMPDRLPSDMINTYPYVGINVVWGKTLRKNHVNLARKLGVALLSLVTGNMFRAQDFASAHETYRRIRVHEIVADRQDISRTDFGHVVKAVDAGYEMTGLQMEHLSSGMLA